MRRLNEAGVDSPRRDCLVLLEDLLQKDRSWVIAHADFELSAKQTAHLDKQIGRRIKREPLAYIRSKVWFYGRFFRVTSAVMVPRPESESFIEIIKAIKPPKIIDIGTGSGCLAITAKQELPDSEVIATDIDDKALVLAEDNSKRHNTKVRFIKGSLTEPLANEDLSGFAVLTNLPYVPHGLITSKEINYEPETALFSGKDGLNHYREFWSQIQKLDKKPSYILTESLEQQHEPLIGLAKKSGYKLTKTDILVQLFEPSSS